MFLTSFLCFCYFFLLKLRIVADVLICVCLQVSQRVSQQESTLSYSGEVALPLTSQPSLSDFPSIQPLVRREDSPEPITFHMDE